MDDRYFGIVMDGEPWYPKGNPWAVHYSGETNGNYFLDALRRQGEATRQTIQRAKAAEEMKRRAASAGMGLSRNNPFQQTEKTDAIKDYAEPANRQTHAKDVEKAVPIYNARKAKNRENQTIMYDRNNPPSAKEQLAATHTNMYVSSLTENEALDYLRYEGAKEQRNYLEREAERNAWYQPENIRNILGYINPVYSAANFFVNPANESLVRRGSKLATSLVPIGVSNMMGNSAAGLTVSNMAVRSAPTTGQFLKQMAIDTPFMYAGAETTDALTRALTPFDSWAQGVSNATGLPEWVTEFSNPGMAWGPGVARGLAGSIVDGSIKNSVENVIQSRSLGKPSETAINELFPVGNPQIRPYNATTQEPPAISWENAASADNNLGIFPLSQRDSFGVNDVRYFGEGETTPTNSFEFTEDPIQMHLKRAKAKGYDTDGIKIIDLSKDTSERNQAIKEFGKRMGAYDEGVTDAEILSALLKHLDNHGHAFADTSGSRLIFHDGKGTNINARISHEIDHILHNPKGTLPEGLFDDSFLKILHKSWDKDGVSNVETEIAARGSQIHDYLGHTGNEPITVEDLEYVRDHYVDDTGLDNDVVTLINKTKDLKELAKWMTKYATIFSLPIILNKYVE